MSRIRYILWIGLLLLAGCAEKAIPLGVTFSEAAGLKPGDNVMIRGLSIGQVVEVDLYKEGVIARVEVQPKFRIHLTKGARYTIESEKLVTGKKMLVVVPGGGAALRPGAVVNGEALPPDPIAQAKTALKTTIDHARDQANGLGRAILNPDEQPPAATGGTVDLDRLGEWSIRLLSVKVEPTTADGSDWDGPGGGSADILAQVWVGNRQILLTEAVEDEQSVEWENAVSAPFAIEGQTAIKVKILDVDVGYNDPIGVIELLPSVADARSGRVFRLAAGRVAELRLRIDPVIDKPPPQMKAP